MIKTPDLRELPELPQEIRQAGLDGRLILFIGNDVSRIVKLPSWSELALKALESLCEKDYINYSELEQLKELYPRKQLSIAELIANKKKLSLILKII